MPKNSKYKEFSYTETETIQLIVFNKITNVTAQLKYSMAAWIINEVAYDATF